jgi:tetratricopeptide (TPR) repeat protein
MNAQTKSFWQQVLSEIEQEHHAASIELLRQGTKSAPDNWRFFWTLGVQLIELGKLEEAEEALHTALANDARGRPYTEALIGDLRDKQARFDDAEKWYLRATASNPSISHPWIHLGRFYDRRARLDEAIQAFKKALDAQGGVGEAYFDLSLCYRRLGDYDKSAEYCRLALGLSPPHSLAVPVLQDCKRALVLRAQNEAPSGKTQPKSIWEQVRLEMEQKHHAASIELLRQLTKSARRNGYAFQLLGGELLTLGRFVEANEALQAALVNLPEPPAVVEYSIGQLREKEAQFEEAEQWYLRATTSNPSSTAPWVYLGAFYSRRGRLDEAIQSFTRAISSEGDVDEAHFNLALCYRRLENYEKSIDFCQLALGLSPDYPLATCVLQDCQRARTIKRQNEA